MHARVCNMPVHDTILTLQIPATSTDNLNPHLRKAYQPITRILPATLLKDTDQDKQWQQKVEMKEEASAGTQDALLRDS